MCRYEAPVWLPVYAERYYCFRELHRSKLIEKQQFEGKSSEN
jgi:hypothetical protein